MTPCGIQPSWHISLPKPSPHHSSIGVVQVTTTCHLPCPTPFPFLAPHLCRANASPGLGTRSTKRCTSCIIPSHLSGWALCNLKALNSCKSRSPPPKPGPEDSLHILPAFNSRTWRATKLSTLQLPNAQFRTDPAVLLQKSGHDLCPGLRQA